MTDVPSVSKPSTQYLIVYATGSVICDVHELVDRAEYHQRLIQGIHLVMPDGSTTPVIVIDISGVETPASLRGTIVLHGDGDYTEIEVVRADDPNVLVEYVHYTEPSHEEFDGNDRGAGVQLFQPAA